MSRPVQGEPYVFQLSQLSEADRRWIEEEYRPVAEFAEAVEEENRELLGLLGELRALTDPESIKRGLGSVCAGAGS